MDYEPLIRLCKGEGALKQMEMVEKTLVKLEPILPPLAAGEFEFAPEDSFQLSMTIVTALTTTAGIKKEDIKNPRAISLSEPFVRPPWMTDEVFRRGQESCLKRPMLKMMYMSIDTFNSWHGRLHDRYERSLRDTLGVEPLRELDSTLHHALHLGENISTGVNRLLGVRPSRDENRPGESLRQCAYNAIYHTIRYAIGFAVAGRGQEVDDFETAIRLLRMGLPLAETKGEPGSWGVLVR
ncbi:MAG: hypothetical protein U9Q03_05075 [Patescibacteria group bacterium]|nr:hypothetical protein [Patescibacteria group bacterium]